MSFAMNFDQRGVSVMAGAAGVAEAPQGQWLHQLDNEEGGLP